MAHLPGNDAGVPGASCQHMGQLRYRNGEEHTVKERTDVTLVSMHGRAAYESLLARWLEGWRSVTWVQWHQVHLDMGSAEMLLTYSRVSTGCTPPPRHERWHADPSTFRAFEGTVHRMQIPPPLLVVVVAGRRGPDPLCPDDWCSQSLASRARP
jgi:hypothetical protein